MVQPTVNFGNGSPLLEGGFHVGRQFGSPDVL
jgi:hypothetical protein